MPLWPVPVNIPAEDKVQGDKIEQMSESGWVFISSERALIKELNHLFCIITLLSNRTAAACLRRNLICLSKNTDRDTPAQRYHGKTVTADRQRQLGMGLIDSYQLSLELCLLLFSGSEGRALTVWHLAPYATFLVNSPPQQLNRQGSDVQVTLSASQYLWQAAHFLCCKCD